MLECVKGMRNLLWMLYCGKGSSVVHTENFTHN